MLTHQDILQLHRQHCASQGDTRLYGLIDHAGMPGLLRQLTMAKAGWVSLFEGAKEANALSVAPILFAINVDDQGLQRRGLLQWILEQGRYSSSLSLIASPLAMPELAKRLALRLNAVLPDQMEVMLRFFDPRVFEQLMLVFSVPQKQAFLDLGSSWFFLDRSGKLIRCPSIFSTDDTWPISFELSVIQQDALIDSCEPDQIAELLRNGVPDAYQQVPLPEQYGFIVRNMASARSFGIHATHELSFFCALALLFGEKFMEDKKWSLALDAPRYTQLLSAPISRSVRIVSTAT